MNAELNILCAGIGIGCVIASSIIYFCLVWAKRSGVLQGCLPSTSCSAEAGAEALSDSLINSVVPPKEAVRDASTSGRSRILRQGKYGNWIYFTIPATARDAYVQRIMADQAAEGFEIEWASIPALAVQRERAIRRNDPS